MDTIDWQLVDALQLDGRATLTALAKHVGLSVPAVTERVRRLEDSGVIAGVVARVDPRAAGYGVTALIGITVAQPAKTRFTKFLEGIPEVLECFHVTGADSYVMKVVATSVEHLEHLISRINLYGETRTSIVMSTTIPARPVRKPAESGAPPRRSKPRTPR
ncbi:Lrp/AsnC family transcriptional regulator [Pararobbsia silviterrae]|uniref:Lrp/AsnC family transcriptional regulator n=1 Tax=Pararobbsia silviterrae TaxID=1792498 RepID=A0A494X8J1_9BURK|nr:Lrp/AsnC family transcriptional regulator [Pararobbsia silviterrae]RKP46582.1 Lrp/AsnC family transcriptional regulator [Pararobbsia silviterrae]